MSLDAPMTDAELLAMHAQRTTRPTLGPDSPLRPTRRRASAKLEGVTEHDIQVDLIRWADANTPRYPELAMLYAIPNGGRRSIGQAVKLKAEGVKPGVLDLHLPVARGGYHGCWIEMKKPGGTTSPAQAHWMHALALHGHKVALCTSSEAAQQVLLDYLTSEGTP